jgi:DNA-binding transcriptional regulator WhiA
MRLRHPELNLIELARRMHVSKSGINHRLRRLVDAADRLDRPARLP